MFSEVSGVLFLFFGVEFFWVFCWCLLVAFKLKAVKTMICLFHCFWWQSLLQVLRCNVHLRPKIGLHCQDLFYTLVTMHRCNTVHGRHTRKHCILRFFVTTAYTVPVPIIDGRRLEPMFGGSGGDGDQIYIYIHIYVWVCMCISKINIYVLTDIILMLLIDWGATVRIDVEYVLQSLEKPQKMQVVLRPLL